MRNACRLLALTAILGSSVASAGTPADYVLVPGEAVAGLTQADWADAWWQWAYSFPKDSGPVADRSGEQCAAGQGGPVWYLAGTYGSRPVRRQCRIPQGRYLFFPIVNYVGIGPRDPRLSPQRVCEAARLEVADLTDPAMVLSAELDGVEIPSLPLYRQQSTACFNLAARAQGAAPVQAAANGYWVMLKPLPPGRHSLRFGAVLPTIQQGVIYELVVEEGEHREPAPDNRIAPAESPQVPGRSDDSI